MGDFYFGLQGEPQIENETELLNDNNNVTECNKTRFRHQ